VTYLDQGGGSFWIEYDTWDDPFQPGAPIVLSGDGLAHTTSVRLSDARLGNSQDGGDLRLARSPGARLEICEMSLAKA
jgi:hypothetical protein